MCLTIIVASYDANSNDFMIGVLAEVVMVIMVMVETI